MLRACVLVGTSLTCAYLGSHALHSEAMREPIKDRDTNTNGTVYLTTDSFGYSYRNLGPRAMMRQALMTKYNMSLEDANTVINLNGNEGIVRLSNGMHVHGERSDWLDNEYYVDAVIDGKIVHSQYHYDD